MAGRGAGGSVNNLMDKKKGLRRGESLGGGGRGAGKSLQAADQGAG